MVLKKVPSAKTKLLALLATNEPPKFRRAFGPKLMPLGLIRNKLALPPLTPSVPKILDGFVPVTRVRMFSIPGGLVNETVLPLSTLNSKKLWKRLAPLVAPPSIRSTVELEVTLELSLPRVASGMIWAKAVPLDEASV